MTVNRETRSGAQARTASVSAFLGTTFEYYDFAIYGVASALIFGPVFFPNVDPVVGALLSLSTFAVAYLSRPLGALIWGHLGDRMGRKRVLLYTLGLMGAATFLVGCLPSYETIGILAPVLLVFLRLLQGISAGGESTGSSAVALEHSPDHRRGFFCSLAMSGINAGAVLATLAFVPVAAMPREAALEWGWRVPFLASALIFVVTLLIRRRLSETDSFVEMKAKGAIAEVPILSVVRNDWRAMLRTTLGSLQVVIYTIFNVYAVSFAATVVQLDRSRMLQIVGLTLFVAVFTQPLFGLLADRYGRRPVFGVGSVGAALTVFAFFASIAGGNWLLILLTSLLLVGVFQAMMNGLAYAYFLELFPARTRFTGVGFSMMIGLTFSGFAPVVAGSLVAGDVTNWPLVALCVALISLCAGVAVATGPETYRVSTALLDRGTQRAASAEAAVRAQ